MARPGSTRGPLVAGLLLAITASGCTGAVAGPPAKERVSWSRASAPGGLDDIDAVAYLSPVDEESGQATGYLALVRADGRSRFLRLGDADVDGQVDGSRGGGVCFQTASENVVLDGPDSSRTPHRGRSGVGDRVGVRADGSCVHVRNTGGTDVSWTEAGEARQVES